jgi:hypothetical protein
MSVEKVASGLTIEYLKKPKLRMEASNKVPASERGAREL